MADEPELADPPPSTHDRMMEVAMRKLLADGTLMVLAFAVGVLSGAWAAVALNMWRC